MFNKVSIIGTGLMGGTFAKAVKAVSPKTEIAGFDANKRNLDRALSEKIISRKAKSPEDAVTGADLSVIATPVKTIGPTLEKIRNDLKDGSIVIDLGSVKEEVVKAIRPFLDKRFTFLPVHPVAGLEKSGPEHAFKEMFLDRHMIMTPLPGTKKEVLHKMTALFKSFGMKVEIMTAKKHDRILATTSHVPHLVAYAMVGAAIDLEQHLNGNVITYSAGGFRDFTRLAGSDPTMWKDIFLSNKEATFDMLQRLEENISILQRAIRTKDEKLLMAYLTKTREVREKVIGQKQHIPEEMKKKERLKQKDR